MTTDTAGATPDPYEGVEDRKDLPAFYEEWQRGEGIPIYRAFPSTGHSHLHRAFPSTQGIPIYKVFHIDDLAEVELGPWARFGGNGAFINLADCHITTAALLEVPAGKTLNLVKHMSRAGSTWWKGPARPPSNKRATRQDGSSGPTAPFSGRRSTRSIRTETSIPTGRRGSKEVLTEAAKMMHN